MYSIWHTKRNDCVKQIVELNCKKTPESGSGKEKAMETFAQRQSTADQGIWKNDGFVKMPEAAGFSGKRKSFPLQTILT